MRSLRIALYIVIILAGVLLSIDTWFRHQDPHLSIQITAVPPATTDEYVLPFDAHISLTTRPEETFTFPVAVGETGPAESLFAGPKQYPFFCRSLDSGLGQTLIDNEQGYGVPVYREDPSGNMTDEVVGYSMDCGLRTRISHYYRDREEGKLLRYRLEDPPPSERIAHIARDTALIPEIYRIENGTINRFIYSIMMLADPNADRLDARYWNRKLIYYFRGGSGIGFRQGKWKLRYFDRDLRPQLQQGYAVISSTGNITSNTYNMLLAEDTARRVKLQFVGLYGEPEYPEYTVGIGGSGGGLTQYLLAQNGANVFDAAIPVYAYPDMVSQTIHLLDCDLLNSYYVFRAPDSQRFQDWTLRRDIEGLNARNGLAQRFGFLEPLNQLLEGQWPHWPQGNSECINGWFGLSTFIHNPRQGFLSSYFSDEIVRSHHWSYWEDMQALFGRDESGFARSTWDNEGVQYGLRALLRNRISVPEFLHLNRFIGSWRPQAQMKPERLWASAGKKSALWFSLWGRHNISTTKGGIAPRHQGDPIAIERAYRSGQVFIGKVDIPVLDVRHYLEEQLDMHHLSASFAARARIIDFKGHANNQVIQVAHEDFNFLDSAFEQIDLWMNNILANPELDVVEAKPASLTDACLAADGSIIASGPGVWDGAWNGKPDGACMREYPAFSNSRIVAGAPWGGSVFKCHLQSIEDAVASGVYDALPINSHIEALREIFPTGVCNYRLGDAGRPALFETTKRVAEN